MELNTKLLIEKKYQQHFILNEGNFDRNLYGAKCEQVEMALEYWIPLNGAYFEQKI